MNNAKTTRKALLTSVVALVICVTMLMGTTFAWFTDTATVAVNTIKSGNLKIDLLNSEGASVKGDSLGFVKLNADGTTTLIDEENNPILWEPGCRYVLEPVTLVNKGNLWAKYTVSISGVNGIVNDGNSEYRLTDVIEVYEGEVDPANLKGTLSDVLLSGKTLTAGVLAPEGYTGDDGTDKQSFGGKIILVMKDTADNNYQNLTIENVSVTVLATQYTYEEDSFGNDYDAGASFPLLANERRVANDAELMTALAENGVDTIYLNGGFGAITLPVGTNGVSLIGENGAKMQSLNINGAKNVVVDGLTFDAAHAVQTYSNNAAGAATNYQASIYDDRRAQISTGAQAPENVTIKNCVFEGTVTVVDETGYTAINLNDGGAGTRIANITIEGCKFNCNAVSYIYIQYVREGSYVTVTNNTFGGDGYSTAWAAVAVQQLNGVDVNITNNTFNSWDAEDGALKISKVNSAQADPAVATITGNTFNGTVNDGECVIELRRTGTAHTVNGNTYNITGISLDDTVTGEGTLVSTVAIWYRS